LARLTTSPVPTFRPLTLVAGGFDVDFFAIATPFLLCRLVGEPHRVQLSGSDRINYEDL
jgi:hypothetical protein